MTTRDRWNRLWSQLGSAPPRQLFDDLVARYREKHRHYHTLRHLDECLLHLDAVSTLAVHAPEIELALWFHDAVYDPHRQDNEALSAAWARSSAAAAPPARFEEYEQGIRDEYSWVPEVIFAAKRRAILDKFLERETIFHTRYFIERYERQARVNLGAPGR